MPSHIKPAPFPNDAFFPTTIPPGIRTEEDIVKWWTAQVYIVCGSNKALTARVLGISRRSLYRRLGYKYGADARSGFPVETKDELECS